MIDARSNEHVIELSIYTDGSCKRIGQSMTFGGWSFIAFREQDEIYGTAGSELDTTNQRMELLAICKALEYAAANRRPSEKVIIYSDSAYVINCYIQEWYIDWMENGWFNSAHKPVANQDLWVRILPYFDNYWYEFRKVEGHTGDFWNEKADSMAQEAAEALKKEYRGKLNG